MDIFDATSGRWTTAALSVARSALAATSLLNQGLAIFAGGRTGGTYVILFVLFILVDVARWCDVGVGGLVLREKRLALMLEMNADALHMNR